ncbi:MAG: M15 family metallopeptidase [Candidatus Limnocylindrales bacterium]
MPGLRPHRLVAITLSAVLLLTASVSVVAVEDQPAAALGPPSLESAVAALASTAVTLAGGSASSAEPATSIEPAKIRLPACEIQDIRTRYGQVRHWKRTLLDTNLRLRQSYQPRDLVSVSSAGIAGSGKVRKVMIADLQALAAAARRAGKPLAVRSAYRSYDYQKSLFDHYVRTQGYTAAIRFSARAGHSEHQLGTTVDFTTAPNVPLRTTFGESPSGKWLARNGWKYGFIMSYPKGKRSVSCYGYEPWHWRYFGRDTARKIHESGQVPRRHLYETSEAAP